MMEIVRLIALHLLIGAAMIAMVAVWVVGRWASRELLIRVGRRAKPARGTVRSPKMAPAKPFRGAVRDLLLQSAD